ncbi:MAG: aerial mycelium formation protein [Actinobacteria bacterium]|nr:aerial mycelium formation protein [Actinomycetota bacterium]MCB9390391.1 aerial mycelium formation protein [Acidimicrobiia bacterium]
MTATRRIDRVTADDYVVDVDTLDEPELRAKRNEAVELETEYSYVRRLAQGRIEILKAEQDRRRRGGSLQELIDRLPDILADSTPTRPAPARARVVEMFAPDKLSGYQRGLEVLVEDDALMRLPDLSENEIDERLELLRSLEAEVSSVRAQLHVVIDVLTTAITRRFGETAP